MKKGRGSDFDRAKRVLGKHFRDKGITAKRRSETPDFDRFKLLVEKHFLGQNETGITSGLLDRFSKELAALDLSDENIFLNLVHYFAEIFWTATMKTTGKPLHTSRDYALKIYAKAFSDMLNGLKEPVQDGRIIRVGRIDFIMFLAGIADSPFEMRSMADSRLVSFAKSDEPVLISGETGTGKEFHAKAIHYISPRSKEKFVAVNCAGIPETLLESELFGHEKGAFTGADKRKIGLFEEVGKGTLFLDEIGDMSISLQAKVLRVLQSGDYRRVGGTEALLFEGRVIAATNRDMRAEIEETPPKFRPDLFYRLDVLPINLPPFRTLSLHERRNAILYKLRYIMHSKTGKQGNWIEMRHLSGSGGFAAVKGPDGKWREVDEYPAFSEDGNPYISEEAIRLLLHYRFPGNYRELDNIIRRAYVLAEGKKIEAHMLGNEVIEIKKDEPQEVREEEAGVNAIILRDIIEHADRVKADMVRRRVEKVYRSGHNLKESLAAEGEASVSAYQTFRNRIETIIGKGEIGRIKRECTLKEEINK